MKKQVVAISMVLMLFLGGCSLLEGVNNTVNYVNEATDYIQEVSIFVKEVPALAEQAVSDEQALVELETKLVEMKDDMKAFNELQAPEIASKLHQQIMEHNQQAVEGIDLYLNNIKDGKLDPSVLKNNQVFESLQEITNTLDQIKKLGQ
ncbi:DUF6376 family protein [Bacillus salitolerans]|uniref:DUF6376 family protein n=1 Tax=Bacillus salitolerans TaxID=1437434 RepID=A0ABW4LS19_9BACI